MFEDFMEKMLQERAAQENNGSQDWSDEDRVALRVARLKACATTMDTPYKFKVGDIVTWKPSLKHKKSPGYGEPMIVRSLHPGKIDEGEANSGSTYFHDPIDVKCALITPDGEFITYYYDSARLQKIG